jgi:DDE domain
VSDFKGRHFEGEIVLWAVRWYCRYGVSYRDLEQMMGERGVSADHSTIFRRVQKYAPEIEKRLRWQWRRPRSTSWRIDETYVKVRGRWAYLYRAVDKFGNTIDFYLSPTRNANLSNHLQDDNNCLKTTEGLSNLFNKIAAEVKTRSDSTASGVKTLMGSEFGKTTLALQIADFVDGVQRDGRPCMENILLSVRLRIG